MNPFEPPPVAGCSCPDLEGQVAAALTDTTPEPCPVHDADELTRRRARGEADELRLVIDELKASDELTRRRKAEEAERQADEEALAGIADPLERAITRAIHRGPALNSPNSAYSDLFGSIPDGDDAA